MAQITIGQISIAITAIVGLITGVSFLHAKLKKWVSGALKTEFETVNEKLDDLGKEIRTVDVETCKNFLIERIFYIERGSPLSDVEKERFYEQYEHYKSIGGNSYITKRVEHLEKDGLL